MVTFAQVSVDTGSADCDGQLAYLDDRLIAVLVQLSDDHGEQAGRWFMEAGFGRLASETPQPFPTLDLARAWIVEKAAP